MCNIYTQILKVSKKEDGKKKAHRQRPFRGMLTFRPQLQCIMEGL